jgi:hypothetical protein
MRWLVLLVRVTWALTTAASEGAVTAPVRLVRWILLVWVGEPEVSRLHARAGSRDKGYKRPNIGWGAPQGSGVGDR